MFDKNKIEYAIFFFFSQLTRIFGFSGIKYFAGFVAFIFYSVLKIRRKVVLSNLKTAFPLLSDKEIRSLAYKNYYSFSITILELLLAPYISKEKLHELVESENVDVVKQKYELNRGVIILTAHFGNWEYGAAIISSKIKIPFNVLVKPQRNPYITKWLKSIRERFGSKEILLGISVRDIYTALKQGGIVGIVGDQRGAIDSPRIKFFGKDTATFTGMGSIALKLNSPVVTAFAVRQSSGKYKIIFDEFKTDNMKGTLEEKVIEFNQRYMTLLESYVRQYPEQWFWMHKIWKY